MKRRDLSHYKLFNVLSLLFVSGWISVSAAESQTVKVQPGEEVNLLCPNMSKYDDLTFWFRLVNGTKMGCVSVMHETTHYVSYCDGFKNRPFEMSSNISTVFLKIKQVNLSDSGLYFCGFYINGRPTFSVTRLNVKGDNEFDDDMDGKYQSEFPHISDETTKLMGVILGGVTVFLFMVIFGLVVKIWKLQKANHEENNPQRSKVIPASSYFYNMMKHAKPKRNQRPASERQLEPNVVYAATR
uniref:Immunoglobulin domain-containing protein n=1 Tax=Mastacembelus armatus TaxID=205130 RepID=A0A3Q3L1H2_9TELE